MYTPVALFEIKKNNLEIDIKRGSM